MENEKDFDRWNNEKKCVQMRGTQPFYQEREIWWCSLGVNVGFEQDGTGANFDRPVLVIRGFNKETCFCVALTGRKRRGMYYQHLGKIEGRDASAILSQVRLVDTKRLIRKMATLPKADFAELKQRLGQILLGLPFKGE